MKKYITSTICSAIIVPGLGQILNEQVKKGLVIMGIVFIVFIAGVIKLFQVIKEILPGLNPDEINRQVILERIDIMDITMLRVIISVFLIIWIYSIVDSFIYGLKVEKGRN